MPKRSPDPSTEALRVAQTFLNSRLGLVTSNERLLAERLLALAARLSQAEEQEAKLRTALRSARPYVFNRTQPETPQGNETWREQTARQILKDVDAALVAPVISDWLVASSAGETGE